MIEDAHPLIRRYVEAVLQWRWLVMVLIAIATAVLGVQAQNLRMIIDPNTMLPLSHPYVATTLKIEQIFGAKYVVVIGITPKHGDIFQPALLAKVQRITAKLRETPNVVKENLLSLSARRAKDIVGTADGLEVKPLMSALPRTPAQLTALKAALERNPAYLNSIVARDFRTAAILAEFKEGDGGFRGIMDKVAPVVDAERDATVDIFIGGLPNFLSSIEHYSDRIEWLFPLAVLIVGLIHFEAFRTLQGLILPLVTPLIAVVWGLGVMGAAGIPLDIFNGFTPILILAVGAGHAVQLLKRYYEEYHRLRSTTALSPSAANRQAVIDSVARVGPVMLTAGLVAALGFFSLVVFDITSVRVFGLFTGIGILGALILEMTFIPALRSLLPAPGERELKREQEERVWDRITGTIAAWLTGPQRRTIFVVSAAVVLIALTGVARVVVDSSTKSLFADNMVVKVDDRALNSRLGGTNTLYVLVEGNALDAIKDPAVLKAIDQLQLFLARQPQVGKTLSLADFVKRMNMAMNGDDARFNVIPDNGDLIAQYLLLYSMSGEPGDFDSYVDYDYKAANITAFLKTDSSAYVQDLITKLHAFAAQHFPPSVKVSVGGSVPQGAALTEVMIKDKILNIVQIAAVVFVISSLVFRSLLAGLLVLTPLMLAVLANFGLMGLTGIRLNIPTSLISAMAVGIGADYAIYLLYRLREELSRGQDEVSAVRTVLNTAGKASLFVASAVAGGYSVQLASIGFYPHTWNAILIASAMLVSVAAALTLLPALVLKFRPAFIFNGGSMKFEPASAAVLSIAMAAGLVTLPNDAHAQADALTIMEKNFVVAKVLDSVADATFTLTNKNGQRRVRKTLGVTKLQANGVDNMRMTRFLSPPDVKGTVSLLIENSAKDDDMWIYLPALKKVRRLVASNKKDSFVGTDFSYGDVIGHKVEQWSHKIVREEAADGKPSYVIESMPKDDTVKANTGYSKRIGWIQKDNWVTLKSEFFDETGQLLKTIRFLDWKLMDAERGRWQAMQLEAKNVQTGHGTVIKLEKLKVNQNIKDDFFTTRYMEREP